MDKYEYKVRADEIKELISRGEYAQAADIADTIDWRRVKSVMMLCTISDLYKINRRYEDARDMLLLAYERRPGGRTICYSLCELSIKMEEFVQAVEFYKEFVQAAPKDPGRFILQYKLYEAQDVSLEERIAVLEELKKRDYREKWAYELAYLYHRMGLAARCVEECDELILWFGEGKYVIKAMELKMLHQPLSPSQQEKYDHRFDVPMGYQEHSTQETSEAQETVAKTQSGNEEIDKYVEQTGDGVENSNPKNEEAVNVENAEWIAENQVNTYEGTGENQLVEEAAVTEESIAVVEEQEAEVPQEEELDIQVKTMDMGQYNTINLQAELAAGLREVLAEEQTRNTIADPITRAIVAPMFEMDTESLDYPEIDEVSEDDLEPVAEEIESTEVFFGETGEINDVPLLAKTVPDITGEIVMEQLRRENTSTEIATEQISENITMEAEETAVAEDISGYVEAPVIEEGVTAYTTNAAEEPNASVMHAEPPRELANVLSQESDGQLSLVMPESERIEKQITGQMNIEDILAEWERMKKENQEKREAEVRQHVLQQTGNMFTEFEAAIRDGLLEQLEREKDAKLAEEQELDVAQEERLEGATSEDVTLEATFSEMETPEEEIFEGDEFFEETVIEQDSEFGEVEELEEIVEQVEHIFEDELPQEAEYATEEEIVEEVYAEAEPIEEVFEGEYAEAEPVEEVFEGEYAEAEPVEEVFEGEYAEAELVEEVFEGEYAEAEQVEEVFEGEYAEAEPVEEVFEGEYAEAEQVEEVFEGEYAEAEPVEDRFEEAYAREETAEVFSEEVVPQDAFSQMIEDMLVEATVSAAEEAETTEVETEEEAHSDMIQEQVILDPEYAEAMKELRAAASGFEEVIGELGKEDEEAPEEEWVQQAEIAEMVEQPETVEHSELVEQPECMEVSEQEGQSEAVQAQEQEDTQWVEEQEHPETFKQKALLEETEQSELDGKLEASEQTEQMKQSEKVELTGWMQEPEEVSEEMPKADTVKQNAQEQKDERTQASSIERDKAKVRALTREEKELYAPFIQSRAAREQLVRAIDNISLAAYTGNVIITGEEGMDTLSLAKNMIRELQATDSNFSGKVAKISGRALNSKDVAATIGQLKNGALIVSKASELDSNSVNAMYKVLQQEHQGIVIVLVDVRKAMDKFLSRYEQLQSLFTARMDVEALSNDTLVAFGRRYARELEYSIDELGMLALHTRIAERQTIDHVVTVIEVKEIVDRAIRRANRKTVGHFFDILFAKRYDEEDMIVLSEKDFV